MEEEIKRLGNIWYKYVSHDHHKDRDCHFKIVQDYRYGDESVFWAEHDGYIGCDHFSDEVPTYEEAQKKLIGIFHSLISNEQEWAREVVRKPQDWDETQLEKAKYILSISPLE